MSAGALAADLGAALEDARNTSGRSRRALAAELGVADTTLLEVERGAANPTLRRVEELAAGYGLKVTITVTPLKEPTP